ncbi:MAG: hypothetical protein QM619_16760 [Micropruina sp.]|uniref:hypothetical protein n=1 Tax=Micropruina sp. TaxID=2737536 RepID=UPI0039E2B421
MKRDVLAELYPPLGLTVTADGLTLRLLRDSDLPAYADLIAARLFADEDAPYVFAWWDRDPTLRQRESLQRVAVTPDTFVRPPAEVKVTGLTAKLRRQLAVGDQS